jgi:transposase
MDAPTLSGIEMCQSGVAYQPLELNRSGASAMKVTTVGIDLAKNLFQVHGVNELGKPVIKKQLRRNQMAEFFVNLPPCLIGMEACGGAHH